jgi:DNA-binding CsgD family transcriptional regulator
VGVERDRLAEDLLSFAQLAPHANSDADLINELMRRVAPWGVTHFGACVMSDRERNFKVGPKFGRYNAAWAETYFGRQLYRDDPVIDFALRSERGEYWDKAFDPRRIGKGGRRVLGVAGEFGARDGYMAPVPLFNGDVVIVSYQGDRLDRHPDVEAVLRGLALYFGVEGQRRIVKSRLKNGRFCGLTARQLQVLHLAALGYRNADIAEELGISFKTVVYHLGLARERLNARNTKEAVAIIHATPENLFEDETTA